MRHPERVSKYKKFINNLDLKGYSFPFKLDNISKFEKRNGIAINVFTYSDKRILPLHRSTLKKRIKEVDLFYYKKHFCPIRNLNRLFHKQSKFSYSCRNCLVGFERFSSWQRHDELCEKMPNQKIEFPLDNNKMLFENFWKNIFHPFVIYADFESIITPYSGKESKKMRSFAKHLACSFCYIIVSYNNQIVAKRIYQGEDAIVRFLQYLKRDVKKLIAKMEESEPLIMSRENEKKFQEATHCHICKKEFILNELKVRDHDHLLGVFSGAAHLTCNFKYTLRRMIPVIFHGLSNYDEHFIIKELTVFSDSNIQVIPKNTERYSAIFVNNEIVFLDSFNFLSSSLDTLVNILKQRGKENFSILKQIFPEKYELVMRKGLFAYEYMSSLKRFEEKQLPDKKYFYSKVNGEIITDEDYEYALRVWREFRCENLLDYHNIYLLSDVALLADVFQNFRKVILKNFDLDPVHYISSPGLSLDSALKYSNIELELITNPDMYLTIEQSIRGGICQVSKRYFRANNIHMSDYNPEKETSFILYIDANNLYGYSLMQYLPQNDFAWITAREAANIIFNLDKMDDNGDIGYFFVVDLEYPKALHEEQNDFPLCAEKREVRENMLSPYQRKLIKRFHTEQKLILSFYKKERYLVHFRNLKLYLDLGLKITKIHRSIRFHQAPYLREYIEKNIALRKQSTNTFEKNLFKLLINSIYGKTLEQPRKRTDIKLCIDEKQSQRWLSKPNVKDFKIIGEDVIAVNMHKKHVLLNKPIYIGFAVLELSKLLMFEFYYKVLKQILPRTSLLYTDTDSLIFLTKHENPYNAIFDVRKEYFDLSNFPKTSKYFDDENNLKPGKFKIETKDVLITEFVGLKPKTYSLLTAKNENIKRAKGIKGNVVKNEITHNHYLKTLFEEEEQTFTQYRIQSKNHDIFTVECDITGLKPIDTKRFLVNKTESLAYGHHQIAIE